jgi:hypothetical protein
MSNSFEKPPRPEEGLPEEEPVQKEPKNVYVEAVEIQREHATEIQKRTEEVQGAKFGSALLKLMERSNDNPRIVNNLNQVLDALAHQSNYGSSGEPIAEGRQEDLADFLGETAKALRWKVGGGNRPADVETDLSKWD